MLKCTFTTLLACAVTTLAGCYSPSGGFMSHSGGPQTYVSTEMMQKTITMVDDRTDEVFFSIDIPPGKQLVIDFDKGSGDDPVYTPDLLRYEVMDRGSWGGKLNNSITVPNAHSRRIEVTLRRGVEYKESLAQRPLRTDELIDRPDWWTPKGGPLPPERAVTLYDN